MSIIQSFDIPLPRQIDGPFDGPFPVEQDNWSLGKLSPTIWTRASSGITIGTSISISDLGDAGWSIAGLTKTDEGGGILKYQVTVASTSHRTYKVPTNAVSTAFPSEFRIDLKAVPGSQCTKVKAASGASKIAIDLITGVVSDTAYLESYQVTSLGDGWWRIYVKGYRGGTTTSTWILSIYDPTGTYDGSTDTWDASGVTGAFLAKDVWYQQQLVSHWADPRNPSIYWEQATAANQPAYWIDSKGPCLVFGGAQYMSANSLAPMASGVRVPYGFVAAIDSILRSTQRCLWSLGHDVGSQNHRWFVYLDTTQTYAQRVHDDTNSTVGPILTCSVFDGVAIDTLDAGATRYTQLGTYSDVKTMPDRQFTCNVLNLGASPVPNYYWVGRMREMGLVLGTTWSSDQMANVYAKLVTRYGY